MIKSIKNVAINAIPKNRPVTYVCQVNGKPNLEFVARTRDANAVISALVNDDMVDLKPRIDKLKKQYDAEMLQFKLDEDGKWLFSFLLTKDGKVIGTKEAYDHRAVILSDMKKKRKKHKKNA